MYLLICSQYYHESILNKVPGDDLATEYSLDYEMIKLHILSGSSFSKFQEFGGGVLTTAALGRAG